MAFLVWTTRVFFFVVVIVSSIGHYRFGFLQPSIPQMCCSLVLKSMIPLQQFYFGSAGAASASAHRLPLPWVLPMIQLRLLKCHWLLSCVFDFSPG
ncbi:hypothetical protein Pelo_19659 [Pelomyxa schiedti]|nr:hypothetical protein Pelo_19659 [Pelomyxa schiedti]